MARSPHTRARLAFFATTFAFLVGGPGSLACSSFPSTSPPSPPTAAAPATDFALRIGTSGDYPPFSDWRPGAAAPTGFSIEIAQAYAGDRDRAIEWIRFRWPELRSDLERGRFDLALAGVTVRPDRSVSGRFSLPLTTSGAIVLVEDASPLHSAADLARPDLGLAVNAGGHLERVAHALFPEARIRGIDRNSLVLEHLGRDGVEAVMTDTLEAPIWQTERSGLRAIGPLTNDRKAAWFRRSKERLARDFDRWLLDAEASGQLAQIRERHSLPATPTARPVEALLASLDERLSLMIDVARAKRTLGAEVEAPKREARVLEAAVESVRREARRHGRAAPNDRAIRALYRAQIEAAKWIQRDWLASQPTREPGRDDPNRAARAAVELDERLRPALIFLGDRIARLVVSVSNERLGGLSYPEVSDALARHHLPEEHLRALHEALVRLATATPPSRPVQPIDFMP